MDYQTSTGTLLEHCSNLISRTMFPSGFALMKLLNSPFATKFDVSNGKALFFSILLAAKTMSLQKDDLAFRFANWAPMLWKEMGAGAPWTGSKPDPLFLTVQFGMNCSHVYDCMWKTREILQTKETSNHQSIATTSGPASSMASHPTSIPSFGNYPTATDATLGTPNMETLEMFNSMDWMFGDWADIPLGPDGFGTQSYFP